MGQNGRGLDHLFAADLPFCIHLPDKCLCHFRRPRSLYGRAHEQGTGNSNKTQNRNILRYQSSTASLALRTVDVHEQGHVTSSDAVLPH